MVIEFQKALEVLQNGEVLGIPTETVYGLAARIDSEDALKKIFSTKQRPFFDPLIVHLSSEMNPRSWTSAWPEIYQALIEKFWPGPLTLIAPKNERISDLITSGLPDVGLRSPDHALTQKLISALGIPVAAPSANMFGKTSPTRADHVVSEFGGTVPVLDGGPCPVGVESTVISFDPTQKVLTVLRPGFVSKADLISIAEKFNVRVESGTSQAAPGQLKAHYQPKAPVVLQFTDVGELTAKDKKNLEEKLGKGPLDWKVLKVDVSPALAARELYSQLRVLSEGGANPGIWIPVHPKLKNEDAWQMVVDRLQRAASLILY